MKKFLSLVLALTMVFALAACGAKAEAPAAAAPAAGEPAAAEPAAEKKQILYVVTANLGDLGFSDSGLVGIQEVCEKYDYEYTVVEMGNDSSIFETTVVDACESGKYDYIITSHQGMRDIVEAAAKDYPDILFMMIDAASNYEFEADNLLPLAFKQYEGSFLTGIYCALMTKTGIVGSTYWSDVPILNDFLTGYAAGIKYAIDNFDADVSQILYSYLVFDDAATCYELATTQYDAGADIIYNVAGGLCLSTTKACEEHGGFEDGKLVVGVDVDQWTIYAADDSAKAQGYENIATSMLKDVRGAIVAAFDGLNDGTLHGGDLLVAGIADGGISMAYNDNYYALTPEDVQTIMSDCEAKILSGEIQVVSYFDFPNYDDFAEFRDNIDARADKNGLIK